MASGLYGMRYSRWLAELASTLEQARTLIENFAPAQTGEIQELSDRIEALRLEVRALQLRRAFSSVSKTSPERTELLRWHRGR